MDTKIPKAMSRNFCGFVVKKSSHFSNENNHITRINLKLAFSVMESFPSSILLSLRNSAYPHYCIRPRVETIYTKVLNSYPRKEKRFSYFMGVCGKNFDQ